MEWSDQKLAETLARNVKTLMGGRGYGNFNQLHGAYMEWVATRPYKPIAINTLRNIGREKDIGHAPQLDRLAQLAEFFKVPVYMLLIEDIGPDPEFAMRLNAMVAAYVNGSDDMREAIRTLVKAFDSAPKPQAIAQ